MRKSANLSIGGQTPGRVPHNPWPAQTAEFDPRLRSAQNPHSSVYVALVVWHQAMEDRSYRFKPLAPANDDEVYCRMCGRGPMVIKGGRGRRRQYCAECAEARKRESTRIGNKKQRRRT